MLLYAMGDEMKSYLRIYVVLVAAYLLRESAFLQGIYVGYRNMAAIAGTFYPHIGNMLISDADPYDNLMNLHVYANALLIVFIASKAFKTGVISLTISTVTSMLVFLALGFIYLEKIRFLRDDNSYLDLLRNTLSIDGMQIWLSAAIIAVEVIMLVHAYRGYRNTKTIHDRVTSDEG